MKKWQLSRRVAPYKLIGGRIHVILLRHLKMLRSAPLFSELSVRGIPRLNYESSWIDGYHHPCRGVLKSNLSRETVKYPYLIFVVRWQADVNSLVVIVLDGEAEPFDYLKPRGGLLNVNCFGERVWQRDFSAIYPDSAIYWVVDTDWRIAGGNLQSRYTSEKIQLSHD